jgi:phosphoribosylformylglycinamidine synthase subunit PurS
VARLTVEERIDSRLVREKRRRDAGATKTECYNLKIMKAHVWVMPKRTVLDPQGQTIHHALTGLGYGEIKDVRQGKFFVLNLDGWNRDEISKEVLTNPVIEEYRFEIVD